MKSTVVKWLLALLLHSWMPRSYSNVELKLGVLLPIGATPNDRLGEALIYAMNMSIGEIKSLNLLNESYTINYTITDTNCNQLTAVEAVYKYQDVDGFIGAACSTECMSGALLAAALNKPMISYSCSSLELSNRLLYPIFARTQPFSRTYRSLTPFLLYTSMIFFKWSTIAIISTEDYIWAPLAIGLKAYLISKNFTVPYLGLYSPGKTFDYKTVVEPVKKVARVIVLLAYSEEAAKLLWTTHLLGMRNGEYAFMTVDFAIEARYSNESWPHVPKAELFATFDGTVDLAVGKPRGSYYEEVKKRFVDILRSKNIPTLEQTINFGAYLIDAVELYAYGVNMTLSKGGDYRNGRDIISNISIAKELFQGVSGPVGVDSSGNRVPYFVFSNRQNGVKKATVEFNLLKKPSQPGYMSIFSNVTTIWPGGSTTVPRNEPKCGYRGEKCIPTDDNQLSKWYYMMLLFPVILIILGIVGVLYYRKKLYERDLMDSSWLIPYNDIILTSPGSRYSSKVKSRVSICSSMGASAHVQQSNVGRFKGELVVLKKLRKDSVHLTREIFVEMKQVRDLMHGNLNQYVGVCVESSNICIISLFCNRGSLQDLLSNDDINLDWMFRQSFANDIATGMEALHNSPVHAHGNLKSSNCLIDSRWVCKITDYGLDLMRASQMDKSTGEYAKYRDLFWTAPEVLPAPDCSKSYHNKTQSGDVYSFGVILYEILTRDEPYSGNMGSLSSKEIIECVQKNQTPPFRPQLVKFLTDDSDQKVNQCISQCWDDDPLKRPTFTFVKKKLRAMGKGKNMNIVDNMIAMMAKYTDQLEDIVEERTRQLAEEKTKTDELLYKMLPRPIAEELKRGNVVAAESFPNVTIFFSDIVGFTSVAAQSTPLQVVDLLNKLYTSFDSVVDEHDVYKVETIGDAYMVVSGLPVPNGERHAGEVATMALNLLSEVRDFQIPHIPSRKVQLRIGIHSGSCVAGVVGLKMPRYCLFGDTVNYASRMESSGLALRIHVSPECKEALDILGGYHLEERGPVSMKGKGTIVTFFLVGKEGFDKPLPDLRYAASLAEHEFK